MFPFSSDIYFVNSTVPSFPAFAKIYKIFFCQLLLSLIALGPQRMQNLKVSAFILYML